jgi:2-haloacid dehalogenase
VQNTVKACVFDAYGTLFDVHSAIGSRRQRLGDKADSLSALWRSKQLEYTWLRSLMGRHANFERVTEDALDHALDTFGISDSLLRRDLLQAYWHLDCYPEVPEMLRRLKRQGLVTAILSNGTSAMLKSAIDSAGLGESLDYSLSVEEVGIYKPDPRVYRLAVDKLAVAAECICFQSANAWDIAGAASFGLRTVWINRLGQARERLSFGAEAELMSLGELPELLSLRAWVG